MREIERVKAAADLLGRSPGASIRYVGPERFGPAITIHRFELDNGLTVLLEIDPSAPVVSLQTWMKVGSRCEKPGKTGISHLFEHLMFGETETTPHGAFDRKIEEAGGETNAGTFLDWTYYHQNLPKEALALGLALEAERLRTLVLRPAGRQREGGRRERAAAARRRRRGRLRERGPLP
jgi:zinc protease